MTTFSVLATTMAIVCLGVIMLLFKRHKKSFVFHSTVDSVRNLQPSVLAIAEAVLATLAVAMLVVKGITIPVLPIVLLAPLTLFSTKDSQLWAFNTTCWHAWKFYRAYLSLLRTVGGKRVDRASGKIIWRRRTRFRGARELTLLLLNLLWFGLIILTATVIRWCSGLWALAHSTRRAFASIPRNMWLGCWVRDLASGLEIVPLASSRKTCLWDGLGGIHRTAVAIQHDQVRGQCRKLPDHVLDVVRPGPFLAYIKATSGRVWWLASFIYLPVLLCAVIYRLSLKGSLIVWGPLAYAADLHHKASAKEIEDSLRDTKKSTIKLMAALTAIGLAAAKVGAINHLTLIRECFGTSWTAEWFWEEIVVLDQKLPFWQTTTCFGAIAFIGAFVAARFAPRKFSRRFYLFVLRGRTLSYAPGIMHLAYEVGLVIVQFIVTLIRQTDWWPLLY